MDPDDLPPPGGAPPCACDCLRCGPDSAPSRRSLKRKLDLLMAAEEVGGVPVLETEVAWVEVENEAAALREALASHQQSIQELYTELEEERNAAASAASEAMSMILRLQREKAEAQMEARQFRRFAEEKMAHDQHEIAVLEDLLFKRDQAVQSLSCEIQAYKHRLASYGIAPISLDSITEPQTPDSAATGAAPHAFYYPPLRCNTTTSYDLNLNDEATTATAADLEKFPFGETPCEHLQNLEQRICQLERMPSHVMEKTVVGQSPRHQRHSRRLSVDSYGSFLNREPAGQELNKREEFPSTVDRISDNGWRDDMSDRVYMIDAMHGVPPPGVCEEYVSTPRELIENQRDVGGEGIEEGEIKKLYLRLHALEADRESMRQALISVGTDKAQVVLLREIAQQLCKEMTPEKRIVKKPSFIKTFSIMAVIKWITSFVCWRKKSARSKYTFGMTSNNAGLLLLLEKSPRTRQRRHLTRTQRVTGQL